MLVNVGNDFVQAPISFELTGPRPKEIKVETFRIDYLIRAPKVEKLGLQPISECFSAISLPCWVLAT